MPVQYLKKSPKTSSTDDTKTTEIVQDLMAILNVFMANINSLRRYKKLTIGN